MQGLCSCAQSMGFTIILYNYCNSRQSLLNTTFVMIMQPAMCINTVCIIAILMYLYVLYYINIICWCNIYGVIQWCTLHISLHIFFYIALNLFITNDPDSATLPVGDTAIFSCTVVSDVDITIDWFKNGVIVNDTRITITQVISDAANLVFGDTIISQLSVANLKLADGGSTYSCRATTVNGGTDVVMSSNGTLNILCKNEIMYDYTMTQIVHVHNDTYTTCT